MTGGRRRVGHAGRAGSLAVIKAYWLRLLAGTVLALSSAAVGPAWAQTITIASGASLTANSITINAGGGITNAGTVTVNATLDNSGTVTNNGTVNADVNNTGAAALINNNA